MPVEWCVAVCSVGSGQPLREGLKGPRMPAKQTKQPSVSGAESKSVRGCRGFSVSWVQVGSLCENRRGQKEKLNSRHSQSTDEKLPCARKYRTQRRGCFWQIISVFCYQQLQSLRSISNVLFWNPHYDNESDFDEEWNQSGRLNVEWMAVLNPSIIRKLEWVGACPDVLLSLFLTDVYSWPCKAFLLSLAWCHFHQIAWTDYESGGSVFLGHQPCDMGMSAHQLMRFGST